MSSNAQEMRKAGVRKLRKWSKSKRDGFVSWQQLKSYGACSVKDCSKRATYSSPIGNICFSHAAAFVREKTNEPA